MANSFRLLDGMRIAYQEWGAGQAKRIITFHGWLDNSNSFQVLGPYLANHGYHVVALDLIGHGQSSHLPKAADYSSIRSVPYVREVLNKCLRWEGSIVIGHSMGAGIGLMYAGCYPETVQKLVMIEGFGPVSRKPMETMFNLRRATDFSIKSAEKLSRGNPQKLYNTFGDLVTARMETVKRFPGHQFISREAASAIMGR